VQYRDYPGRVWEAYYRPSDDYISMPAFAAFKSAAHFNGTTFYELGHWTGHKSRLDRDLKGRFGERAYAAEELIAELRGLSVRGIQLGRRLTPCRLYRELDWALEGRQARDLHGVQQGPSRGRLSARLGAARSASSIVKVYPSSTTASVPRPQSRLTSIAPIARAR
jgi:hypothetical protein